MQLHANVRNVINSVTVAKMGLNQQLVDNYIAAIAAEQDIVNKAASIEDQGSAAYKARFTVEKNLFLA